MGCGIGKPSLFTGVYTLYPELTAFRPQFEKLLLKEPEIGMLYKLYTAVDVDRSGEISYEELLVHIDVENTPFSKRIFTIFDEDGSGQISFHEFVLTLW
jgi:Ca2+-binding EF-hand superfamily protein